jgi:phenylpyruvate tautomerase PptA (4-oxalocrotonate tautomerase family)
MIKIGDRVTLFTNMSLEGTVVNLEESQVETWFVGGTASKTFYAHVKLDTGRVERYHVGDLMRLA